MFTVAKNQFETFMTKKDMALMEGVQIVMTICIMLIVGVIGLFIGDKVLTVAGTFADSNMTLAKGYLLTTVATGFNFLVILVVAAIGGVALMYVMRYMGQFFVARGGGGVM